MRNGFFRCQKGFSFVELMVVIAMISIVTVPLIYWEISFSERFHSSVYRREMIEAGNRTLEWIARDMRTAVEITQTSGDRVAVSTLAFRNAEGMVIEYQFDRAKRNVVRAASSSDKNDDTFFMEMARNVDDFRIISKDSPAGALRVTIDLSRPLLKSRETVSMTGIATRRIR